MPHIVVKMYPGRTEEMKSSMVRALVEAASDALNAPQDWFTIGVEEVSPENWEEQVAKPEIMGKADTLYFRNGEFLK